MTGLDKARLDGALTMKARIIEAVRAAHARDTGYDQHEVGEDCDQCQVWYEALRAIEEVEP